MKSVIHKEPKDSLIKARCEADLANYFNSLAMLRKEDTATIVREALRDYRARQQATLCQATTR